MVDNRKKEMNKIAEKLRLMHVNMVFLEGSIDKESHDTLLNRDIVVMSRIDAAVLNKYRLLVN